MLELTNIQSIRKYCSEFLDETHLPLEKYIDHADGFLKIKVRHRTTDLVGKIFNNAFPQHNMMAERAVYLNNNHHANFYIFPVNGFKFIYSKEIVCLTEQYQKVITTLSEDLTSDDVRQIVADLIKFSYTNMDLTEGISSNCEIIIYNIPFFYAVNKKCVDTYEDLLKILRR